MKAIMIFMFVLFINVVASIINAANDIDQLFYETKTPFGELYTDLEREKLAADKYLQNPGVSDTTPLTFGDYLWGAAKFMGTIGKGVVAVPYLLKQFGITNIEIKVAISFIVYAIYIMGLWQMIANRAAKSMY